MVPNTQREKERLGGKTFRRLGRAVQSDFGLLIVVDNFNFKELLHVKQSQCSFVHKRLSVRFYC